MQKKQVVLSPVSGVAFKRLPKGLLKTFIFIFFATTLYFVSQYSGRFGMPLMKYLGKPTQSGVYLLLKPFHLKTVPNYPGGFKLVVAPLSPICLNAGSCGLFAVALFLCAFGIFYFQSRHRFHTPIWMGLGFIGVFYMYFLNLVRLSFQILIDLKIATLGDSPHIKTVESIINGNLGWVLYSTGILTFLYLITRVGRREELHGVHV